MQAISIGRSNITQTAWVSLLTFVALVLLGLVLAYWTWHWLAPAPEPRIEAAVVASRLDAAYGLFGSAHQSADVIAPSTLAVSLLGVVAAAGSRSGTAVLRLDANRTVVVREGGKIGPGIRLAEVHEDRVVLERSGVRETLIWPKRGKAVAAVAARPSP